MTLLFISIYMYNFVVFFFLKKESTELKIESHTQQYVLLLC